VLNTVNDKAIGSRDDVSEKRGECDVITDDNELIKPVLCSLPDDVNASQRAEVEALLLRHANLFARHEYDAGGSSLIKFHLRRLQSVLNAAAKLVVQKRKYDHVPATLRDDLHWLPIVQRAQYKDYLIVYKCLHQQVPEYLTQLCIPVASITGRCHLRSAAHGELDVPRTKTKTYGPRSFAVAGPTIWNTLPSDVCDQRLTTEQFRSKLKTHLFQRACNTQDRASS
jgi:hypothetical protein